MINSMNSGSVSIMPFIDSAANVSLCCCTCIFSFLGACLLVTGAYIAWMLNTHDEFLPNEYVVVLPATLLIIVGIVIVVVSFCAFWGAVRQSPFMVLMFGVMLSSILALELTGGVLALQYRGRLRSELGTSMIQFQHTTQDKGEEGDIARAAWDTIQTTLECCGVETYSEWPVLVGVPVPESCHCNFTLLPISQCTHTPNDGDVFSTGCRGELFEYVQHYLLLLGVIGFAIVTLQLSGLVCSVLMLRAMRRRTYQPL